MNVDVSSWQLVGETVNTKFYAVEEGVIAGVPNDGASDDGISARANTDFQNEYFRRLGRPGVVVVFFDRMVSQNKEARSIYQTGADPAHLLGSGLIGGTMLSRAMISFSMGFGKVSFPVKLFPTLAAALVWARELRAAAKKRESEKENVIP